MSHYNNNQQHSQFNQHSAGPPPPQWQASAPPPRKGWGDPRPQSISQPSVSSPISPYAPQGFGQFPAQQWPPPPPPGGPPPAQAHALPGAPPQQAVSQYDTSSWGVKYNQTQPDAQAPHTYGLSELRPPLPPRPNSAQSGDYNWNTQSSSQQKPPTPPPRPPQYAASPPPPANTQAQNFYYPHEQYSNRPVSHHYDPPVQQNWSNLSHQPSAPPAWQQPEPPVSPIEPEYNRWSQQPTNAQLYSQGPSHTATPQPYMHHIQNVPPPPQAPAPPLGPSALGPGGPQDWSHYQPEYQQTPSMQQPPPTAVPPPPRTSSLVATPEQMHALPAPNVDKLSPSRSGPGGPQTQQRQSPAQAHVVPTGGVRPAQHGHSISNDATQAAGRQKLESESSASSMGGPERSGTIDSVIQAWNTPGSHQDSSATAPAPLAARLQASQPQTTALPVVETQSAQTQTDFPPQVKTETKIETKIETKVVDPYSDLKEHYRTSLDRYADMLRQEKTQESELAKMKVIMDFINREIKLRSVLYNVPAAELIRSDELTKLREAADKSKDAQPMVIPPKPAIPTDVSSRDTESQPQPSLNTALSQLTSTKDDSFVMVNKDDDEVQYSPGGRPLMAPLRTKTPQAAQPPRAVTPMAPQQSKQHSSAANMSGGPPSPSSNAPMVLEDYMMPEAKAPWDKPIVISSVDVAAPAGAGLPPQPNPKPDAQAPRSFSPARPAYTPFKYTEPEDLPKPTVTASNPANQAYTKLRHEQAIDSGRILGHDNTPSISVTHTPDRSQNVTPSRAKQQQEEAFIGLLRQQSRAVRKAASTPPPDAPAPLRAGTPHRRNVSVPPLLKAAEAVKTVVPDQLPPQTSTKMPHQRITPIVSKMKAIADEFDFIHNTVVAWDKDNRKHRQQLENERSARESESQARIDELFNDNEIGYADIGQLEEDFKLKEADRKYKEEQAELESFSRNVFEVVTKRLNDEVNALEQLRIQTLDLLDLESLSASRRIRLAVKKDPAMSEKIPLADTMDTMLKIFNKIEIRNKKIAEAYFEQERRRKRLELSVFYANGDKAGVKSLEKDFDKAQSIQVLAEARKKDERANKLMDSFDRVVVRGLSENQEWIDDTSNKMTLLRDLVLGSESNGPQGNEREDLLYGSNGVKESLRLLGDAVTIVMHDSRDLITMSNQADIILNEADFAMFLAEAKIADADAAEFDKLKSEKAKEDLKLKEEFDNRVNGINKGPEEILAHIRDVRDFIGEDKDHKVRIASALEAAKKRNETGAAAST